jgi:uracil phosphoribosyltransferase
MDGVTVVDHPLVRHKLTLLRNKARPIEAFCELVDEIAVLLCYEVTRDLPLETTDIETPPAKTRGPTPVGKKLVFAAILRAGHDPPHGAAVRSFGARYPSDLHRDLEMHVAFGFWVLFSVPDDVPLIFADLPILAAMGVSLCVIFPSIESHVVGWALRAAPSTRDQAAAARWP